jgi:hypothetical protein
MKKVMVLFVRQNRLASGRAWGLPVVVRAAPRVLEHVPLPGRDLARQGEHEGAASAQFVVLVQGHEFRPKPPSGLLAEI